MTGPPPTWLTDGIYDSDRWYPLQLHVVSMAATSGICLWQLHLVPMTATPGIYERDICSPLQLHLVSMGMYCLYR